MQKNKKRKGFTLTELAIVIAVIAILIAVLVPTFTSLINSANESADKQAVKSMNTALASAEAMEGKPADPSEAMKVLEEAGFNIENYQALESGNTIYYDSSYNRCLVWTVGSDGNGSITYPSEMQSYYPNAIGIAANWYTLQTAYSTVTVSSSTSSEDLTTALTASAGETKIVQATTDLTLSTGSALSSSVESHVTLDMGGNTLTISGVTSSSNRVNLDSDSGATLYIKNAVIEVDKGGSTDDTGSTAEFKVNAGCSLTLENVTYYAASSGLFPNESAAQVNVIDSTIIAEGNYGIATNASSMDNYGVLINISGSYIESKAACGVCMNTGSTLNISDSEIVGVTQGLFVRAGTATITDTKISASISTENSDFTNYINYTNGTSWSSGVNVAIGAVVVGNSNGTYNADTVVTLTNCTLSHEITDDSSSAYSAYNISLYAIKGTEYATTVTISGCTMNNNVVNYNSTADLGSYSGTVVTSFS